MNLFIIYIIESAVSISLFYTFYELLLKKDTWFRFNRYYLLFGLLFSLVLPLIDFSISNVTVNAQNQFEFSEFFEVGAIVKSYEVKTLETISKPDYIFLFYLIIGSVFFMRLLYGIFKIFKTVKAYEIIKYQNYKLVLLNNNSLPFSFFNHIFLSKDDHGSPDIPIAIGNREGSEELLLHELTHARQKHSIDVILLELLLVLQWFNPFMYWYRQAFKEIHEYLADQGALAINNDRISYQKLILGQVEKNFNVCLTSQFNYSLTKKRIKMMTRINSGKIAKLKYVLIVPLISVLLMAFTIDISMERVLDKNYSFVLDQVQKQINSVPSIFPVEKTEGVKISSGFGMRNDPISKKRKMHNAIDIKAPKGTAVYATADGLVREAKYNDKGYGNRIIIDHEGGYSTLYSQLSAYNTKEGAEVKKGEIIGYVGSSGRSTGPHLHYEIKKDGENVDPAKYF